MSPQEPSPCIRVLAVDDHPLLREGIIGLISSQPDMTMVGEAATGAEAVAQFLATRPDVVLMDLQMPEMDGIEAIRRIRAGSSSAKIIVLTTYGGDTLAERALTAGAHAYVLKSLVRKELLETIRAVHRGRKRIQPEVASALADHISDASLTAREIEVLSLIALGNSNRMIGVCLSINEDTVKGHVKNILSKLGARDRTHAVTLSHRRGIIQL